ncbi:hypothetical protein [Acinetobacter sp. P8-3-8]|uniref:hypothetical protein n=1 Tax=Acinetobacter sp. P8-3-8 TaxID=1029823 RepID=UPI001D0D05D4|nr:hypothetical protein [Acinetobacter sp. P8-3-8]
MKKLSILCILGLISSYSFACDPTSLDWKKFHQTYDLNKNKTFELKEFSRIQKLSATHL